jgi:hypothetical protein
MAAADPLPKWQLNNISDKTTEMMDHRSGGVNKIQE